MLQSTGWSPASRAAARRRRPARRTAGDQRTVGADEILELGLAVAEGARCDIGGSEVSRLWSRPCNAISWPAASTSRNSPGSARTRVIRTKKVAVAPASASTDSSGSVTPGVGPSS